VTPVGLVPSRNAVFQLSGRGFCSELNVMLLALHRTRATGGRFILCTRYWNATAPRGWRDYFEPFTDEWDAPLFGERTDFATPGRRFGLRQFLQRAVAFPRFGRVFLTRDLFDLVWNPAYADAPGRYAEVRALLTSIWRLRPETRAAVDALRARLGLTEGRHVTIHVRRGDKRKEADLLPLERYIERARATAGAARDCFVMTDDLAVVPEIARLCPEWRGVAAATPDDTGHDQGRFNALPAAARREATVRLVAELSLANEGLAFVGTFSSNVTRFVALLRGLETTHGVDYEYRMYV